MISIILPAHNAERFIGEAIDSVLAQSFRDFELIVIDDGSIDGTLEIVRSRAETDSRLQVVAQANVGVAETLNRGIEMARHDLIGRIDADDRMLPNRLERQLRFLEENPDLAVAGTLIRYISEDGTRLGTRWNPFTTRQAVEDAVRRNKIIAIPHNSVLMRRSAVLDVGGYRKIFDVAQDLDLWNRLAERGHALLVQPEVLTEYRLHGQAAGIRQSRLTYISIEWMRDCMIRRRRGETERTLDEFLGEVRRGSFRSRIDWERRLLGRVLYTDAVHEYGRHRYLAVAPKLTMSLLLTPKYVGPRLIRRLNR